MTTEMIIQKLRGWSNLTGPHIPVMLPHDLREAADNLEVRGQTAKELAEDIRFLIEDFHTDDVKVLSHAIMQHLRHLKFV